jgi:hypothetical protein
LPYIIGEIGWMDDYAGVNVDQFMDRIEQLTGMGYVTGRAIFRRYNVL